jgi:sigma-B regulation protein RsbU (phosphoserine phosphatase)
MNRRIATLLAATCVAILTFSFVRGLELVYLYYVEPPRGEIRSVTHIILTTAFGVATYLWLDLRAARVTLTSMERAQVVVETQLALAADVQRRLLPPVPSSLNHVRWASQLKPAGKIGGDFYDFIPTAHDGMLVLVGDVSGKGIPAALLQASAHSLFRTFSRVTPEPADLLQLVSREIYTDNGGALYLTCLVVRIDSTGRTLMYANAGHPAGLLLGRSGSRLLSRGGPPAGMFEETVYQSEMLRVEPGDLGVIVTDGITEAIEQDGVSTVDQLNATVSGLSSPWTPERVCDELMALADHGAGPAGVPNWQDDKTVLAFLVEGDRESVPPASEVFILAEPHPHV